MYSYIFALVRLRPPSTRFPYTTLFRSARLARDPRPGADDVAARSDAGRVPRMMGAVEIVEIVVMVRHRHEEAGAGAAIEREDRKSTRLNSSHLVISYAVFCLKKKKKTT